MTDQQLIPLVDVRRLDLQPGDTIVLTAPPNCQAMQELQQLAETLDAHLREGHPDVRILVLPHGSDLTVLRPDENQIRTLVAEELRRDLQRQLRNSSGHPYYRR